VLVLLVILLGLLLGYCELRPDFGTVGRRPEASPPASYECVGEVKQIGNWNGEKAENGGAPPTLKVGEPSCLVAVATYHWNSGGGQVPGTITLSSKDGALGPWRVETSAGQFGAPNVNWVVNLAAPLPLLRAGDYTCVDSDAATWSQNAKSGGKGFCWIEVKRAVVAGGTG
jgi:hypothetical protein